MRLVDRRAHRRRGALALSGSALAHGLILLSLFTGLSTQTHLRQDAGVVVDISAPFVAAVHGQPTPTQVVPAKSALPTTTPPPSPVPPAPPATPDSAAVAPVPSLPTAATLPPVDPTLEPAALTPASLGTADATAQATASAPACDLTGPVQQALQADASSRLALGRIPPKARSVANAIMFWDAGWPADTALGGAAITAPIRQRIVEVVSAAPAICADQLVLGPRFVSVTDVTGTTVIALGSGAWKWSDLLRKSPA